MLVILLPVSLLLALLFSLGRMSRANEIVSMLTAGVSIPAHGRAAYRDWLVTTVGTFLLNYALALHMPIWPAELF